MKKRMTMAIHDSKLIQFQNQEIKNIEKKFRNI